MQGRYGNGAACNAFARFIRGLDLCLIRRSGHGGAATEPDGAGRRERETRTVLLPRYGDEVARRSFEARLFSENSVSSGPVSIVVVSAMITSIAKIRGERMPRS